MGESMDLIQKVIYKRTVELWVKVHLLSFLLSGNNIQQICTECCSAWSVHEQSPESSDKE